MNSKGQILNKKDFNTHTSVTPTKKNNQNITLSSHNKTLHTLNQTEISYAASSGGVSYAELQIILENVKAIKQKASSQIKTLQAKNKNLQKKVKELADSVDRYEHLQETIKLQKKHIQIKFQGQIVELKRMIQIERQKNNELTQQIQLKEQQLQKFNIKYGDLQKKSNEKLKQLNSQIFMYKDLMQRLAINENSHQVKIIEQKFENLPTLISSYNTLQTNFKHSQIDVEELKGSIQQLKTQLNSSQRIIQTVTTQNKNLIQKLQRQQENVKKLQQKIENIQKDHQITSKQQKQVYEQLLEKVNCSNAANEAIICEKQVQIEKMRTKLHYFEQTRREVQEREQASRQEVYFKSVVDEVCDEYEDYKNVIKRVEYLQKYRSEYFFNIEKIQYLCKILDS